MSEPSVRIPGIVLASLAFQHVNGDSDVEGLILGESRFDEQITISDSQSDHIQIEEVYNVQKHIACKRLHMLYCSSGQVNEEEVKKLLVDNKQSVIGWYRQRGNTHHQMSFRERLFHHNLKNFLSNPHLIFLLLTPEHTGSAHRLEYSAHISRNRSFVSVPVLVCNLGLMEQQTYWKVSSGCSAAGYRDTVQRHSSRFYGSDGLLTEVTEVNHMNDSLQAQLQKVCTEVEESERLVETLQTEVSALRKKLKDKQPNAPEKAEAGLDSVDQWNNALLQEALSALFGSSPLLLTQTLNLQASPIPDRDVSRKLKITSGPDSPPSRKRLGELTEERERKRTRRWF